MKRPSTDTLLVAALLLLLIGVTSLATFWQAREEGEQPVLATFSSQADGARALRLWLEESGYAVTTEPALPFAPPPETGVAMILEPQLPGIGEQEWERLDEWVEAGGTLILVGEGFGSAFAFRHYDFDIGYDVADGETVLPATPLLASPPLTPPALEQARPRAVLRDEGNADAPRAFAPLLTLDGEPILLWFRAGEGMVLLSTLTYPFTNAGLKEAGNGELVLNLLALAGGPESAIWFDEWHHGVRANGAGAGPIEWVRQTPAGHALLYAGIVLFATVALAGWRFGRAVPLGQERQRRSPLEHITAVANLKRRAGHRQATLAIYHRQLKRVLGRRYRLDPAQPDDAYVATLARYRPDLDQEGLLRLLTRLRAPDVGEGEMVRLAQEVDAWLGR